MIPIKLRLQARTICIVYKTRETMLARAFYYYSQNNFDRALSDARRLQNSPGTDYVEIWLYEEVFDPKLLEWIHAEAFAKLNVSNLMERTKT